jgi:hypothetical protein
MVVNQPKPPSQIFIVGMNGSGTTMLRDHLANHSCIYGFPAETRSLPYFIMHPHEFGDLNGEDNFLHLWRSMKKSLANRASFLPEIIPMPEKPYRTAAGSFNHIMQYLAQAEGKRIWCEKTPMYVHHMPLLADAFPSAKFIHIIRDGRDCAASFHRRWRFNPVRTIARWKKAVQAGTREGKALGARYMEVRYEAVTEAPDKAFRDLLEFLRLPFEDAVLRSARSRPDRAASQQAEVKRNVRRAEDYFDPIVAGKLEAVAGRLLTDLRYPCRDESGDSDPPAWQMRWWYFADDMRRFAAVVTRRGRILRPSKWRYIARRTRNALKQRATSK